MTEKKKRGRKPEATTIEQVGPVLETKASPESIAEQAENNQLVSAHQKHLKTIDENYGNNLPYDRGRLENECRFYLQSSAASMLEAGKRLVLMKEHEKHGDFIESIDRIGIAPRAAQKMMQASIKFANPNAPTLAHLGQSKLFELMVEDDEDLESLAEGGTIAGLTLDKIDKMSVRELKATLRKEREKHQKEQEANEKLIAKKDETINKYARDAERVHDWPEIIESQKTDIMLAAGKCIVYISALRKLIDTTLEEALEHKLSDGQVASVAEPFNDHIKNLVEHVEALESEYADNLSGYLNLPPEKWANADEPEG